MHGRGEDRFRSYDAARPGGRHRLPARRRAAAAAVGLLLAGCGSTVAGTAAGPAVGLGTAGPAGLDGSARSAAGSATAGQGGAATSQGAGTASAPGAATSGTAPQPGTAAPGPGTGPARLPSGASAPGVTATSITLGFDWIDESSGTNGVDPSGKLSLGDQTLDAKAMADYFNSHGGVAGRKVRLNISSVNYAGYFTNAPAENAQTCAQFTQDDRVFMAVLELNDPELVQCLEASRVPSVSDVYVLGAQAYRGHPRLYFSPGNMEYERAVATMVRGLTQRGFLKSTSKVGILYDTEATYGPVLGALKAALSAAGVSVAATYGDDGASASDEESDSSAAVLRFRALGVDTVMFVNLGGALAYLFMNSAQSQQYFPSYGLSTADNPTALALLAPSSQLTKATVVGWTPGEAASEQNQAQHGWNATGRLCYGIESQAGADMSSFSSAGTAIGICDMFLATRAMIERAPVLSVAGVATGAASLGTSFQGATTFRTRLDADHPDGPLATRYLTWSSPCTCWLAAGAGPDAG